jgi:predicted phage terminase large subunit-like protein
MSNPESKWDEFWASLTPVQINQYGRELAKAKAAREHQLTSVQDYSTFKRTFWRDYDETPFQRALDDLLMQIALYLLTDGQQGINRAMIFAPPRHGKSENVSRYFPAWLFSRLPELNMMLLSYGDDLAYYNSRFVRNLLQSRRYRQAFPHVNLIGSRQDEWYTDASGGVLAGGIASGITGHGARVIIIDDAHKNRAEAESATIRRKVKEAYMNDILTRLEEPGVILLMNTRYHTDDLPGWLLSQENADDWKVLKLPALATENDSLGREPGAALWEARYPAALLEKRREQMGTYNFSSIYQQEPITKEDALFDTAQIEIIDTVPPLKQVVRFYDLAVSAKTTADYSVGVKMGITADETLIVLDVYRKQTNPAQTGENIILNALRDSASVNMRLEADNAARTQLDYLLKDSRLRGFTIDAVSPQGDKYTRAAPLASRVNAGKLKLVRASWNDAYIDELSVFPAGRNDDQVDATSGAYTMLSGEETVISVSNYFFDVPNQYIYDGKVHAQPPGHVASNAYPMQEIRRGLRSNFYATDEDND